MMGRVSPYPVSMSSSPNNPWFAATMLLTGLIVGYVASSVVSYAPVGAGTQVAAQPTPSAPTPSAPTPAAPAAPSDVPAVTDRDYVRGDADAEITVIEYSDFECPFCKRHHPTMEKLVTEYDGKVNWVYRHFPLSFHPNAMPAAIAAECAGKVGGNDAFWKYADELIKTDTYDYAAMATTVGLDAAKFKACNDDADGSMAKYVTDQADAGGAAGVGGTPGNFIVVNSECDGDTCPGIEVSGAVPFASFKSQIDGLLE